MPLLTDTALAVYTFRGSSFVRQGFDFGSDSWFSDEAIFSKEPLLGGGVYRDVAGVTEGELSFTAVFDTVAQRDALIASRGQIDTLSKVRGGGGSRVCCLIRATPTIVEGQRPGALVTFS